MSTTKIEWADFVWNPVTGCSKVSEGCRNCYAESLERRFRKDFKPWTAPNAVHNVRLHPERLEQPLQLSKPRRIFVNSVSDLFHEHVSFGFIDEVFYVMENAEKHIFQILTKRPKRMADYFERIPGFLKGKLSIDYMQPLPNVWLGISAEDQPTFDERATYLLQTPAAVRFVSLEPLLGPIDPRPFKLAMRRWGKMAAGIDWVIVGGESGPSARPIHPDWVRSIRDQCQAAGVPFFFKQWGAYVPIKDHKLPPHCELMAIDDSGVDFRRVGKRAAGNVLDGRTWEEYPE